jgi:hypothetical protein
MAQHRKSREGSQSRPQRKHRAYSAAQKGGWPDLVKVGAILIQLGIAVYDHHS